MIERVIARLKESISEDDFAFITDINHPVVKDSDKGLILELIQEVSSKFFALKFLSDSTVYANFVLSDSNSLCSIFASRMVNSKTNILMGKVEDLNFIIGQHVTSCDFIYFPKYSLFSPQAHSNTSLANRDLRALLDVLVLEQERGNVFNQTPKQIGGLIISHARPYHFFYDTAIMLEVLYNEGLLKRFRPYQIQGSNFFDLGKVYDFEGSTNILTFNELNEGDSSQIFFKIGLHYEKFKDELKEVTESLDYRLVNSVREEFIEDNTYIKLKNLKKRGVFLLWFAVATEKRSLENQVDLAVEVIKSLSMYHDVCVVVDGWTTIEGVKEKVDCINIDRDSTAMKNIKDRCPDVEFVSLIGATSKQKIALASLVDFHVTSAATGSMWVSRFVKKKGIMHSSLNFRSVCEKVHIHNQSIFVPFEFIQDIGDKSDPNYTSYRVEVTRAVEYLLSRFPIITTKYYYYDRFDYLKKEHLIYKDQYQYILCSIENNSKIHLNIEPLRRVKEPYVLTIIGFMEADNSDSCNIVFDFGEGYIESTKHSVKINRVLNSFSISITIEQPLLGIRFDPVFCKTEFKLQGLFYKVNKLI